MAWIAAAAVAGCAGVPAPIEVRGASGATAAPDPRFEAGPHTPLSAYALTPEEAFASGPRPAAHLVAPGETLFDVATRYQIPLRALIEFNGLAPPFRVAAGRRLLLPPPVRHVVASGDTLESLGRRYAVAPRSLALLNRLDPNAPPPVGRALVLPTIARASTAAAASPSRAALAPPPRVLGLAWPADGAVTTRFGPQPGGRRSDGIDIAAKVGAPVVAAADGAVAYAGRDLPGYGDLVLLQHPGGLVTAYARLGTVSAAPGQRLRRGDPIGAAGPQSLHFQVRTGGAPSDPLAALAPRG